MTTVTTLAQFLPAHPGPWNGGYGWYPFFPFVPIFGFFFFAFILFLVFGVFGRRRGWGPPQYRDAVHSAESDLARRFAAGEIDEKEYEQRISTLRRLGRS